MISITPSSRFHRILKKLARCLSASNTQIPVKYISAKKSNEILLGVYQGNDRCEDIVFTDEAFLFTERDAGKVVRIPYSQLQTVDFPLPASTSVELVLGLVNGSNIKLYVVGVYGNERDVFEVGRFFMRVIEDKKER